MNANSVIRFRREKETKAFETLSKVLLARDILLQYYTQLVEPMLLPDLYGKTIKVTPSTYPQLFRKKNIIAGYLQIPPPEIFIYENYYYGAETVGLTKPWLEISANTITDFTPAELTFLIGRQLAHIYLKHYIIKVHSEQLIKSYDLLEHLPGVNLINVFGTLDAFEKVFQLIYLNWTREICHTADIYGMLFCGNVNTAISAIIKLIVNNVDLANELKVSEYLKQKEYLSSLKGIIAYYTKYDETVPYGPLRIVELLKYLSYSASKKTFYDLKTIQEALNAE